MKVDTPRQHLLLIDGFNVVRRIYEAVPGPDSPQKAEGAVNASIASLRRALEEHEPTHVLAAFDHGGSTWRHELFPAYRANRRPMPEPLKEALPELFKRIVALGVPIALIPGVEADDVIATAFGRWKATGRKSATILSTDKDLTALVADGARVWDHFSHHWRDEAWIQGKFGVPTRLVHDLLALTGDSADGIPGVPGVGVKTAAKWLNTCGSLEQLLAEAITVPGKAGEALCEHLETVRLARQLVSFKTDFSLGLTWNALRFECRAA